MQGIDVIELIKAFLYGLVEGITEWLPISSTGHMLLLSQFVQLSVTPEFWDLFLVVIQLGAILAVCTLFFEKLNPFSSRKTQFQKRETLTLWLKVILACVPAALVGIPLDDWMEEHLSSPFVIAAALMFYGVLFIVIENRRSSRVGGRLGSDSTAPVQRIEDMSWACALGIGLFQVLSLVPGTSRSGSTIIGGLLLGCSRTVAAEFTFFLAIPVMFGASALRLAKFVLGGAQFLAGEIAILLVGSVVAYIVSVIAIRFLMDFVKRHDFKPFGWYRICLGVIVILYFALRGV